MASEASAIAVIRGARPSFRNDFDKMAFAVHACFLSDGYFLIAAGNSMFGGRDSLRNLEEEEVGVEGIYEREDRYGMVYLKIDNGKKEKVLVRCLVIGDNFVIDVLPLELDQVIDPYNFQVKVVDYVQETSSKNYSEIYKNLSGFVKKMNENILSRIGDNVGSEPTKTGKSELKEERGEASRTREPAEWFIEERESNPYLPIPTGGGSDLFPGPPAGVYPRAGFVGDGGMLVGPNDPRWGFGGGEHDRLPGGFRGPVPPGARFDPYGPPGVPGFEPGRFIRNPRQPRGGDVHPDLQHFQNPEDGFI